LPDRMIRERTRRITVEEGKGIFPSRYEAISRPALTDVEATTIRVLIAMHFEPGAQIAPFGLFPPQSEDHIESVSDWAYREIVKTLANKGYLKRVRMPGEPMSYWPYEMTQEAIDAYRAWYDRRGHMGDDPNALLP
jgi:hypothetical protein